MAAKDIKMALVLVFVLMTWHSGSAQSGCSNALMSLSPCLKFVTGNSTKPSPSCCSSLKGVVQTQPQCLCTMVNSGVPMAGFAVNQTLAMALPAACNLKTPPVSQCNTAAANGPTASAVSPASAPVGSPSSDSTPSDSPPSDTPDNNTTTTPSQTTTPSTGSGSKTVPSTTGTSSGAITIKSPLPITLLLVFFVSVQASRF